MHYNNPPEASAEDGNNVIQRNATVVRQPGDGHCLFHSLGAGLQSFGAGVLGTKLRRDISHFLIANADQTYGGANTWRQWIHHEAGSTLDTHCNSKF